MRHPKSTPGTGAITVVGVVVVGGVVAVVDVVAMVGKVVVVIVGDVSAKQRNIFAMMCFVFYGPPHDLVPWPEFVHESLCEIRQ